MLGYMTWRKTNIHWRILAFWLQKIFQQFGAIWQNIHRNILYYFSHYMFNNFCSKQIQKAIFDCFVCTLVFPSYISCCPEQAHFTGFLPVIFKEHHVIYSILPLSSSLAMLHCAQWQFLQKSDHLAVIRMGFSWSQIWGFQLNWKQHWLSRETETFSHEKLKNPVPNSGFTEKIKTKQTKNVWILILAFSSWQYRHIFLSQRICFGEISEENVLPLDCEQ